MENIKINIIITRKIAIAGAITATTATNKEVVVSINETIGFPKPAVVAVDANLPVAEAPLMAVAVPPPAMTAKDQVITGSRSAMIDYNRTG